MSEAGRTVVLDASALLASAFGEPGGEQVRAVISGALISAANWSEFFQEVLQRGVETRGMRDELEGAGLQIVPVSVQQAEVAASLWPRVRPLGLSLADRLCLALGMLQPSTVHTADRVWLRIAPVQGLSVVCIRPDPALHDAESAHAK